jgi:nitrile hydratase accessory protein
MNRISSMSEDSFSAEPERVFGEPWHASVFAFAVKLSAAGHFTWAEWTEQFGARLKRTAIADGSADDRRPMPEVDNASYYDVWLDTLEGLLIARGLASAENLNALKEAWTEAYLHTPHGMPVKLGSPDPAHDHDHDHDHDHPYDHDHLHAKSLNEINEWGKRS